MTFDRVASWVRRILDYEVGKIAGTEVTGATVVILLVAASLLPFLQIRAGGVTNSASIVGTALSFSGGPLVLLSLAVAAIDREKWPVYDRWLFSTDTITSFPRTAEEARAKAVALVGEPSKASIATSCRASACTPDARM